MRGINCKFNYNQQSRSEITPRRIFIGVLKYDPIPTSFTICALSCTVWNFFRGVPPTKWRFIFFYNSYFAFRSVGCTVIEMLTTKPPLFFENLSLDQKRFRIVHCQVDPPENCSPGASEFLQRCLR